jgi:hypothetical protein
MGLLFVLLATVAVVFVKPFGVDESYYIYRARLNIDQPLAFDAMLVLLKAWMSLFSNAWTSIWLLRVLTLLMFLASVGLMQATLRSLVGGAHRWPALVVATGVASWMALNRGFEIRPEALAHLCLLGALFLVCVPSRLRGLPLLGMLAVLILGASMFSFRFWMLGVALFFSLAVLAVRLGRLERHHWLRLLALTAGLGLGLVVVHGLVFDLATNLRAASAWKDSNQQRLGVVEALRFGIGYRQMPMFYFLWAAAAVGVLWTARNAWRRRDPLALVAALGPAAAYYLFFFAFEVQPFRYTRAVETVALFCSLALAVRLKLFDLRALRSFGAWPLPAAVVAWVVCAAILDNFPGHDRSYLSNAFVSDPPNGDEASSLDRMRQPRGLSEQLLSRMDLCGRQGDLHVLASRPNAHPFCGVDAGSVYNTGFQKYPDELRFGGLPARAEVLVSADLVAALVARGHTCVLVGKHYARCRRA